MSKRVAAGVVSSALLAAFSLLAQQGAATSGQNDSKGKIGSIGLYQNQRLPPDGPAPKFADGTPDLSGVWLGGGSNSTDISNPKSLKPGDQVIMLPWAEEVVKHRLSKQDPEANCLPAGIPRGSPYPWRIVQTPTHYFILYEGNIHSYRQIFMNGKHPDDPDPTWYGHSIGHWEGNTLVVDTVGFNDKFWFDYKGHPHTEKLHTIERYTRTDFGHMAIEVTIDDPGTYVKPFTTIGKATLMPGAELMEYICQENNQDLPLLQGPARGPGEQ
ncbi:MAG TPA: hypothetical protein VME17_11145 [Bryobacteraceae bacterium]|nr:hypothetical protein [Bryobacteraceae bacterium]